MLLCCDFDGTLYRNGAISDEDLAALKRWRAAGNLAVIASGRNLSRFRELCPDWRALFDYVILDNGGATFNKHELLELYNYLDESQVDEVLRVAGEHTTTTYYYTDFCDSKRLPAEVVIKIRLWYHDLETLWAQKENLEKKLTMKVLPWPRGAYSQVPEVDVSSQAGFIDIVPNNSGKEEAIRTLANKLDVITDEVVAIGDDYNDVGMLERFNGVVMDSGCEEVKRMFPTRIVQSVAELISALLVK